MLDPDPHPRPARIHPSQASGSALAPGFVLAVLVGGAAMAVAAQVPVLTSATIAVAAGAVMANTGSWARRLMPGAESAGRVLLRVAVVLLGLQLSLGQLAQLGAPGLLVIVATVTVTFVGTQLIARWCGVSRAQGLLVATGFAICGASAVAAMARTTEADDDDQSVAIALVTLCGTAAIVVLPLANLLLGLPPEQFGSWVGASVQDVGQTVAAAEQMPGALHAAVVVKLSRVVLLAPLVAGVAVWQRVRCRRTGAVSEPLTTTGKRPPVVPWFVTGFLAMVVLATIDVVPVAAADGLHLLQELLLSAALFGLGAGIQVATIRRAGLRAIALGAFSWLLVAGIGLAAVGLLVG